MPRGKYERKKKQGSKLFVSQKPKSTKEKRIVLTELAFQESLNEARREGEQAAFDKIKQDWRENNKDVVQAWNAATPCVTPGPPADAINPAHYRSHPSGIECITITEHFNFNRGNAIKYIWRADEKGSTLENLRKAQWYLNREISRLEKEATK